jgi:hypothetical protein
MTTFYEFVNIERVVYLDRDLERDRVVCLTCKRRCVIPAGKKGWCATTTNKGGRLYSLMYGEVASL